MSVRGAIRQPITVYVVRESRRLYRICGAPDTEGFASAFQSNYERGRPPRGPEKAAAIIHMGLSTFDSPEQALKLARAMPKMGGHVATLDLIAGLGLCIAKTGRPGHWSIWARPEQLLECVSDVVEVSK